VAAGALALALAAFGCGDNSGNPIGYEPQASGDSALLLLNIQPANADSSEIAVYAQIFDRSTANGYRLYVDPGGQGFRPATDYLAAPTQTFSTGVNGYQMRAIGWDYTVDNVYLGRGSRNGLESTAAPKTKPATLYMASFPVEAARKIDVPLVSPADSAEVDSLPTLSWAAVPGAVRYRVLILGRNGPVYWAVTDGTTQTVGAPAAFLIENLPMRGGFLYRWGVEAIDAQNRLMGFTRESRALLVQ
jgi:hypothetical protein